MPKKEVDITLTPRETLDMLNPGEAKALLSPLDRSVLIALDGRMTEREILDKSGISHIAFILSCYRLIALGLIEEKPSRRRRQGKTDLIS